MHVVVSSEVSECSRTRIRSEVMPGAFEGQPLFLRDVKVAVSSNGVCEG